MAEPGAGASDYAPDDPGVAGRPNTGGPLVRVHQKDAVAPSPWRLPSEAIPGDGGSRRNTHRQSLQVSSPRAQQSVHGATSPSGRPYFRRATTTTAIAERDETRSICSSEAQKSALFEFPDGEAQDGFLKDLINVAGLRSSWEAILRRLHHVEGESAEMRKFQNIEWMDQQYVPRLEYIRVVEGSHEMKLQDCIRRLDALEVADTTARQTLQQHDGALKDLRRRVVEGERNHEQVATELQVEEVEGKRRHEQALKSLQELKNLANERQEALQKTFQEIRHKLADAAKSDAAMASSIEEMKNYMHNDGQFQEHIKAECMGMLTNYVEVKQMHQDARKIGQAMLEPFVQESARQTETLREEMVKIRKQEHILQESVVGLKENTRIDRQNLSKFQIQCRTELDLRAKHEVMDAALAKVEEQVSNQENKFLHLRELTTSKVQESVNRTEVLQAILMDHEHALQHHAEELLNRSSKYDLSTISTRLESCAQKEKVDAEVKELQTKLTWISGKIEHVLSSSTNSWNLPRRPGAVATAGPLAIPSGMSLAAGNAAVSDQEPAESSARSVSRTNTGVFNVPRLSVMSTQSALSNTGGGFECQGPTEAMSMLRLQSQSLAQCLLALVGLLAVHARHSPSQGLSREARTERETELWHHVASVLHWITHRAAPPDWDPSKLTTLAVKFEPSELEYEHTSPLHHASPQHPARRKSYNHDPALADLLKSKDSGAHAAGPAETFDSLSSSLSGSKGRKLRTATSSHLQSVSTDAGGTSAGPSVSELGSTSVAESSSTLAAHDGAPQLEAIIVTRCRTAPPLQNVQRSGRSPLPSQPPLQQHNLSARKRPAKQGTGPLGAWRPASQAATRSDRDRAGASAAENPRTGSNLEVTAFPALALTN